MVQEHGRSHKAYVIDRPTLECHLSSLIICWDWWDRILLGKMQNITQVICKFAHVHDLRYPVGSSSCGVWRRKRRNVPHVTAQGRAVQRGDESGVDEA